MPKVRQDAWSHEDDLLLAETVLRHIREGSTQLKAFDEVGDVLNRTSAACGFRWNAEVRQKYEQAVELAKKQRKEKKREEAKQQPAFSPAPSKKPESIPAYTYIEKEPEPVYADAPVQSGPEEGSIDFDQVIHFLKDLQRTAYSGQTNTEQVAYLEGENERLAKENEELNRKLESMADDYQSMIQIMDRARKMVMFDDQEGYKPQFRMEKNGNLENVAR
ncbi:RsfA family transcriptional regulator [Halobacillus litoralis]|uniref:RsfA family transcriptional regulator n=1 Tax=Halobacillus litoralis TaxID=45668 RepID=UPI001CD57CDD|nr:RsfA family transcriptional regulator [Halobacillus litoralis]MCA0969976.1 RsfA family transcriptional regulator [Halobacillus litoralis]